MAPSTSTDNKASSSRVLLSPSPSLNNYFFRAVGIGLFLSLTVFALHIHTALQSGMGWLGEIGWQPWISLGITLAMTSIFSFFIFRERQGAQDLAKEAQFKAQRLTETAAELENFAYVASHDLQEPLRVISTMSSLLVTKYPEGSKLDERALRYLNFVISSAKRHREMIQNLLEYSRTSRQTLEEHSLSLKDTVQQVVSNFGPELEQAHVNVVVEDLPKVLADEKLIARVFQHLIANSIKYRHPSRAPQIVISTQIKNDRLAEIKVSDNGIGFDDQFAERIFEIFHRLHTQDEIPGTGIGLTLCRKIIQKHGGQIWAHGKEGFGSEFCFTLSLDPALQQTSSFHV